MSNQEEVDKKAMAAFLRLRDQIARNLIALREKHDISLRQLEDISGISRHNIHRIEYEEIDPKLSTLVRLATSLGVSLEQLLSDTGTVATFMTRHSKEILETCAELNRGVIEERMNNYYFTRFGINRTGRPVSTKTKNGIQTRNLDSENDQDD